MISVYRLLHSWKALVALITVDGVSKLNDGQYLQGVPIMVLITLLTSFILL